MNSFTFGDQAFLARAAVDWNPAYPLGLSGMNGWFKADSFVEADNQLICTNSKPWINQGGGGNASRADANTVFKTNVIGNMPVVRFDGSNLGFYLGFTEVSYPGDFTIIIANSVPTHFDTQLMRGVAPGFHQLRRNTQANPPSSTGRNISTIYDGGSTSPPLEWWGGNVVGGYPATPVDSGGIEWPIISDTFQINVFRRSGANYDYRQNKLTVAGSGPDGIRTFKLAVIGDSLGSGGGAAGPYDFGEILMYSAYHDDTALDDLYDKYLKPRWVTLP